MNITYTCVCKIVMFYEYISRLAPILPQKRSAVQMMFVMLTTIDKSTNE
jgi:hypothetical protein